jgi:tRNA-modifying protein YgfZ
MGSLEPSPNPRPVLADREDLATLVITGEDRLQWIQGLVTCDVAEMPAGSGRWGLLLGKPGKVLAEVIVLSGEDRVFLAVPASRLDAVLDHLVGFLVMEDADVTPDPDRVWLLVHRAPGDLAGKARDAGFLAGQVDWRTEPGVALVLARADRPRALAWLAGLGVEVLDGDALHRYRIEAFMPAFGTDFDERHNPHDASLERVVVSWEKGCYLGQEAVCMLDMRGKVKRRLVTLVLEGPPPPAGAAVREPGVEGPVGEVTSSVATPTGASAFARVAARLAEPGQVLDVGGMPARVLEGPPRG